jgi:hypothetical protein
MLSLVAAGAEDAPAHGLGSAKDGREADCAGDCAAAGRHCCAEGREGREGGRAGPGRSSRSCSGRGGRNGGRAQRCADGVKLDLLQRELDQVGRELAEDGPRHVAEAGEIDDRACERVVERRQAVRGDMLEGVVDLGRRLRNRVEIVLQRRGVGLSVAGRRVRLPLRKRLPWCILAICSASAASAFSLSVASLLALTRSAQSMTYWFLSRSSANWRSISRCSILRRSLAVGQPLLRLQQLRLRPHSSRSESRGRARNSPSASRELCLAEPLLDELLAIFRALVVDLDLSSTASPAAAACRPGRRRSARCVCWRAASTARPSSIAAIPRRDGERLARVEDVRRRPAPSHSGTPVRAALLLGAAAPRAPAPPLRCGCPSMWKCPASFLTTEG